MATGKPAIGSLRGVDLRSLQTVIDQIRERLRAIEASLTTASQQAGQSTLTLSQSNASISNLQTQIVALRSQIDQITAAGETEQFVADVAIGQYDAVFVSSAGGVSPISPGNPVAIFAAIGVAIAAAAVGSTVTVRRTGVMTVSGAAFEPGGPVYAGIDGPVQIPDYVNVAVPIGVAVSATAMFVSTHWPRLQVPGVYPEFELALPVTYGMLRALIDLVGSLDSQPNGIIVKVGDTLVTRSIVASSGSGVVIDNGSGVAGDPHIDAG